MLNDKKLSAVIFGFKALMPSNEELAFFERVNPVGFILFARNIDTPEQVKACVAKLRECVGWECPVLIDQEGGRVARLRPPHWPEFPAAEVFANEAKLNVSEAKKGTYNNFLKLGKTLKELGVNVNCAPMLDLRIPDAHEIVGDRSFGETPEQIIILAEQAAYALINAGVMPVIKHIPGHGRAMVDSHEDLPVVNASAETLREQDFKPFAALSKEPWWGMTAHIIYTAFDEELPATQSPTLINIIRNEIGFDGFLVTDDLSMKALRGTFEERTTLSLEAGCDAVLHCNGDMREMLSIASAVTPLSENALKRLNASLMLLKSQKIKRQQRKHIEKIKWLH